jgi:hypothetical protein
MKLYARLFPLDDRSQGILDVLLRDGVPRIVSARWPVAVDNPVLSDILQAGESTKGFWVSGEAVFSQAELNGISHYEAVCRKMVKESPSDYDANTAACKRTRLFDAGGEAPIRLVSELALSHILLKPNMVGAIGDWTQEYVVGSGVAQVFTSAGLTGFSLLPISHPKRRSPHERFFQLFCESILKPATLDCSVECIKDSTPEENGHLRHMGCLSYAESDLADTPDFSRTAEPWGGWHGWPLWVVRARVKQVFTAHKLRGWAFRPVLIQGTDLYGEYLAHWQHLCDVVAKCSRSKFDAGRW